MGLLASKKTLPVVLLIVLILVWTSVWSLFRIVIEAVPPFSFRVIIGIPAFILLLILGLKKVKTIRLESLYQKFRHLKRKKKKQP